MDYFKCDVREIAYTELASILDVIINSVKTKINGLRPQFVQELAKAKKKSDHSIEELYTSSWIHYTTYLSFLFPIIRASKSRDTLKQKNLIQEEEIKVETGYLPPFKNIFFVETKLELLLNCTEAITSNPKKLKKPPVVGDAPVHFT